MIGPFGIFYFLNTPSCFKMFNYSIKQRVQEFLKINSLWVPRSGISSNEQVYGHDTCLHRCCWAPYNIGWPIMITCMMWCRKSEVRWPQHVMHGHNMYQMTHLSTPQISLCKRVHTMTLASMYYVVMWHMDRSYIHIIELLCPMARGKLCHPDWHG